MRPHATFALTVFFAPKNITIRLTGPIVVPKALSVLQVFKQSVLRVILERWNEPRLRLMAVRNVQQVTTVNLALSTFCKFRVLLVPTALMIKHSHTRAQPELTESLYSLVVLLIASHAMSEPSVQKAILEEEQIVRKATTVLAAQRFISSRVLPVLMVPTKLESEI